MNFTDEQIEKQFDLLPDEVQDNLFAPGIESKIQTAGADAGLTSDQIKKLNALVNFVILGLVPERDLEQKCHEDISIEPSKTKELVKIISQNILVPMEEIRLLSIKKRDQEAAEERELFSGTTITIEPEEVSSEKPATKSFQSPDVAPENLPTYEEGDSLLPPIPLKFDAEGVSAPAHPFEEKMKKVFTAGQQSLGDLAIEPPSQASSPTQAPKAPPIFHTDPYREPIE